MLCRAISLYGRISEVPVAELLGFERLHLEGRGTMIPQRHLLGAGLFFLQGILACVWSAGRQLFFTFFSLFSFTNLGNTAFLDMHDTGVLHVVSLGFVGLLLIKLYSTTLTGPWWRPLAISYKLLDLFDQPCSCTQHIIYLGRIRGVFIP